MAEPDVQQISKACEDAPGYVLFAAVLQKNRDPVSGNNRIDFHYRRYHFAFEDTKQAIEEFRKHLEREIGETFNVGENHAG